MAELKGVCIGAGYFSQFHYEAWQRIPDVEIGAISDLDPERLRAVQEFCGIRSGYRDYREMLASEKPDFVDIITPPQTHLELCRTVAELGIAVICQKPLAPTFREAQEIVRICADAGTPLMVHENWRFNPWYREIKKLLDSGVIGKKLFSMTFETRLGDGWGERAYLDRQPYFRDYPRLLIYETGVHFIDTFRYLGGEVARVGAVLRRLNPVIRGEDYALLILEFREGGVALWNANRYNEPNYDDPRYTFGELLVEAEEGSIRLYSDGKLTVQKLGEPEKEHPYHHAHRGFSGDCVYLTQRHFVERLMSGETFETSGPEYLKTLAVQEAAYQSRETSRFVSLH